MVETSTLLTCQGVKALEGSNPSVSAIAGRKANAFRPFAIARDGGIRTAEAVYKTTSLRGGLVAEPRPAMHIFWSPRDEQNIAAIAGRIPPSPPFRASTRHYVSC